MLWSLRRFCSRTLAVVDPSGQAVPRARIEIVSTEHRLSSAALYRDADSFGQFSYTPVRWGTHEIYANRAETPRRVSHVGFRAT
jgi:hypothetical protein